MPASGRRHLGLGEIGEVALTPGRWVDGKWVSVSEPRQARAWRARVYVRGHDGLRREVRVIERKRGDAEASALRRAEERLREGSELELTARMRLPEAGEWYLAQIARADSRLSRRTVADYSATWRRYVVAQDSSIRALTLAQANDPQRLTTFLRRVADEHGTGASKMARSSLAGLFRLAVENGVLTTNALRQVRAVNSQTEKLSPLDHTRAFTREERDAIVAFADAQVPPSWTKPNPRTVRKAVAVADLIALLAGTGVRIGEARTICWSHVDLNAATLYVDGTKTTTAARSVNLPGWLRDRLVRRAAAGTEGFLISSPAIHDPNTRWEQSNSTKAVRVLLDAAGFEWAIPHTFRRTVATLLHQAGAPIARIADQLGHADPSLTARVYLGRDFGGDKADLADLL